MTVPSPILGQDSNQVTTEGTPEPSSATTGGLFLLPPATALVSGPWEARALVANPDVNEVAFLLDGVLVTKDGKWPFRATLPLAAEPAEQTARIEGYGPTGDLLAYHELKLSPPSCMAPDYPRTLVVTVTDRRGRPVTGLTAADFLVERGAERLEILRVQTAAEVPLTLGLVVDASGSMLLEDLGEIHRATAALLDAVVTPEDRCFAVAFGDRPWLVAPLTSSAGEVSERLRALAPEGSSSLFDAVVASLSYQRPTGGRRVLLILSDGVDTKSRLQFSEALEYAKLGGVVIYTVELKVGLPPRELDRLARITGGRYFSSPKTTKLPEIYAEIAEELRSQVLLTYSGKAPRDRSGKTARITVAVQRAGLEVRGMRTGCPLP